MRSSISTNLTPSRIAPEKSRTTEVDRDILEKLEAPLNHLLRNALDHGLETPEERQAAGKTAEGTIRLEARHVAGMLSISVSDDGHGVDLERLRAKVARQNLASEEMAEQLSEAELLDFLFLPSFSTADQVTEISGRGVGLDVVHSMVQEVSGVLRAISHPGQGMEFNMQLPLTLSVTRHPAGRHRRRALRFPAGPHRPHSENVPR